MDSHTYKEGILVQAISGVQEIAVQPFVYVVDWQLPPGGDRSAEAMTAANPTAAPRIEMRAVKPRADIFGEADESTEPAWR